MKAKRFITAFLSIALVAVAFVCFIPVRAESEGISFTASQTYRTANLPNAVPRTFEAWIKVDKNASSDRLGVIIGNYEAWKIPSYGVEIRTNGNPSLWWSVDGKANSVPNSGLFTSVDLRTGEWTHIAITVSETKASCYINGVLKETITATFPDITLASTGVVCIGGDHRASNAQWLKSSSLRSAAIFSDVRTASEIAEDKTAISQSDGLLGSYDLSVSGNKRLKDSSQYANHLVYSNGTQTEVYKDTAEIGMSFNAETTYKGIKPVTVAPRTFEATVYFPSSLPSTTRGGVILGNYNDNTNGCVSFEVYHYGNVRMYLKDSGGAVHDFIFDQINLYNGKETHVAVTLGATEAKCYIDGVLKQTKTYTSIPDVIPEAPMSLGGDLRPGNIRAFAGQISSVALYSDIRTEDEIKSDIDNVGTDSLILNYSTPYSETEPESVTDLSGNGYDLIKRGTWFANQQEPADYAYSFAIVGDTQIMNRYYPENYTKIYD